MTTCTLFIASSSRITAAGRATRRSASAELANPERWRTSSDLRRDLSQFSCRNHFVDNHDATRPLQKLLVGLLEWRRGWTRTKFPRSSPYSRTGISGILKGSPLLVKGGLALLPNCSQRCKRRELSGLLAAHQRLHDRVQASSVSEMEAMKSMDKQPHAANFKRKRSARPTFLKSQRSERSGMALVTYGMKSAMRTTSAQNDEIKWVTNQTRASNTHTHVRHKHAQPRPTAEPFGLQPILQHDVMQSQIVHTFGCQVGQSALHFRQGLPTRTGSHLDKPLRPQMVDGLSQNTNVQFDHGWVTFPKCTYSLHKTACFLFFAHSSLKIRASAVGFALRRLFATLLTSS